MIFLAHLASGILLYYLLKKKLKHSYLFYICLIGSLVPDLDALFGKQVNAHRYTVFHAPLFWLGLFVFLMIIFLRNKKVKTCLSAFLLAVGSHLFFDWITGRTAGIQFFYPFSKKIYSLYPLHPEKGNISIWTSLEQMDFWRFYWENKLLVALEAGLIFGGLFLLLKEKFTNK